MAYPDISTCLYDFPSTPAHLDDEPSPGLESPLFPAQAPCVTVAQAGAFLVDPCPETKWGIPQGIPREAPVQHIGYAPIHTRGAYALLLGLSM